MYKDVCPSGPYAPVMPLEGHWQRQNTPVAALPRRDVRALIAGAIVVAVIALVTAAGAVIGSSPPTTRGCKRVTVAMTTGGAQIERCPH
jgi:hypothetical protein